MYKELITKSKLLCCHFIIVLHNKFEIQKFALWTIKPAAAGSNPVRDKCL